MYGVSGTRAARYGFTGQKFYWCSACGKHLKLEDRAADNKKLAQRKLEEGGIHIPLGAW